MKKLLLVFSMLLLIFSTSLNLYQYFNNTNSTLSISDTSTNSDNIEDCYIMYVNYFINSDGLEFDLPPVINCLLSKELLTPYETNGIDYKIISELLEQKSKLEVNLLNKYINILKSGFFEIIESPDFNSMSLGFQLINDKDFIKEVIENTLNKKINTNYLIFYMKEYKKYGGDKDYLIKKLDLIKNDLDKYEYYENFTYNELLELFSN